MWVVVILFFLFTCYTLLTFSINKSIGESIFLSGTIEQVHHMLVYCISFCFLFANVAHAHASIRHCDVIVLSIRTVQCNKYSSIHRCVPLRACINILVFSSPPMPYVSPSLVRTLFTLVLVSRKHTFCANISNHTNFTIPW